MTVPAKILIKVVLPAPLGPRSPKISPCFTSKFKLFKAWASICFFALESKFFLRFSTVKAYFFYSCSLIHLQYLEIINDNIIYMSKIKKTDHFYLIDGSGYIFRAYYALPPLTRKSDGLTNRSCKWFL